MKKRQTVTIYGLTWSMPIVLWQLVFFVFPLLFLLLMSFWLVKNYRMVPGFDTVNWVKMFSKDYFWDGYWRTLGYAAVATLVTSIIAFPCSFALAFKVSPLVRRWALFFLIVPFFTSYLVRIFSWQIFLNDNGIINVLLGYIGIGPFSMLYTFFGTLVGYLTLCLPLAVVLQLISLSNVDRNLIEAAHNLGCGRLRTVFAVIIPLAKIGIIIAALFCFILSFGDFVSPYYLGGSKPPTLSILIIDTTKSGQQWPRAAVIAVTMIVTLFVIMFTAVATAYRKRS
ncbi:MAG: ABC transporter permease [Arenicellales bacterium]|nr:ABC transporter permease [Arenicellales bacterium]MDP6392565.1 ABC transporter permease [Arenicellales bacterium]MDP7218194.1 ABC transporter permease [Arenicellales bacterium]